MRVKKKNNNLLRGLYTYKALAYAYFAMFILEEGYKVIYQFALILFLFNFTVDSWHLIKNVFKLYRQEKDSHD